MSKELVQTRIAWSISGRTRLAETIFAKRENIIIQQFNTPLTHDVRST